MKKSVRNKLDEVLKEERRFNEVIVFPKSLMSMGQFEIMCKEECLIPCPGKKEEKDNIEVRVLGYKEKHIQQLRNSIEIMKRTAGLSLEIPDYW